MKVKDGTKIQYVYAYDDFAKAHKITWQIPHYTQEESLPFIPDEKELDQLINSARSKRTARFFKPSKKLFADSGEAQKIRWIDISKQHHHHKFPSQRASAKIAGSLKQTARHAQFTAQNT